jgi:UDP-glucose:glycoprotein glucosyltransferase
MEGVVEFLPLLQQELTKQGHWLREYYYEGHIEDGDIVENLFYDLPTTPKRRNRYLYPSSEPESLRIHALPQLMKRTNLWDMYYVWPGMSF